MADYDKKVVGPLLRRKAHLEEVGADPAKLAELDHALRMAGYPVDSKSSLKGERVEQEKPGVPRAEDENPPFDPPHDDHRTPRDDQAKADEKAEKAKVETEQSGPPGETGKPGTPDHSEEAKKTRGGDMESSATPSKPDAKPEDKSDDESEKKAKHVQPKERSSTPKAKSEAK